MITALTCLSLVALLLLAAATIVQVTNLLAHMTSAWRWSNE